MEIIRQRDKSSLKCVELKRSLRNLEVDKRYLEEHCNELCNKIRELECKLNETKFGKLQKPDINKKPFCSTVRSSAIFPNATEIRPTSDSPADMSRCPKCFKAAIAKGDILHVEMLRLQNDNKAQSDAMEELHKQVRAFNTLFLYSFLYSFLYKITQNQQSSQLILKI